MPESDLEVQERNKEVFGFTPCLWHISVIHAILAGDNMITIAKTGSGKSKAEKVTFGWSQSQTQTATSFYASHQGK